MHGPRICLSDRVFLIFSYSVQPKSDFGGIIYRSRKLRQDGGERMNDEDIIELYWARDESAITETDSKYRNYLLKIAYNILSNSEDGQEVLNDTYLKAWNAMPPHKPSPLSLFLGKITRQLSIDVWRKKHRSKRGGSEYEQSLDELQDCVSGSESPEESLEAQVLAEALSKYLRTLSQEKRDVFVWRYYFCDPIKDICTRCGQSESKIKSMLHRMRGELRDYLKKEGFSV